MTRNRYILFIILLVSAALRLWSLGSGDTLSDEVLYSFRAIGMLDFDEAADQTTPLEWFDPFIPSWTKFSFHDHPPLVFLVQYVFMRVFGETPFAFRLPSALSGIASIYLLYLIGARLYNERVGLLAATLLSLTANHIAISRLGLQESYVLFFILLAIFFFIRAGKQQKFYISVGAALGLAALTKYTTLVLLPIFFTYLMFFRRKDFATPHVLASTILALILFSPVLYYNYQLYKAVGHFDFQLSYIVGQNPEVWSVMPGKEEYPTLTSRATAFLPTIVKFNSWLFLLLFGVSIGAFLIALLRNSKEILYRHAFLIITFVWLLILIIGAIGPSLRFLSMLTPFMALGIATFFQYVIPGLTRNPPATEHLWTPYQVRDDRIAIALFSIIFFFELGYSINSQLLSYPYGPELWAWSSVRYENYNWGYGELDTFMREKTDGRMPSFAFEAKYHFIEKIHKRALANAERAGKKPLPALFVYDKNINSIAQIWTLDRLQIYHAWPIITADTYVQFLSDKGKNYFKDAGFTEIYYIFPTENVPQKKPSHLTDIGEKLEQILTEDGLIPYTVLENKRSEPVFRIYQEEVK